MTELLPIPRTIEAIENYSRDSRILLFCKQNFLKFMPTNDVKSFIQYIVTGRSIDGNVLIHKNDITKSKKFFQYHKSMFDKETNRLRLEIFKDMQNKIFLFIHNIILKESKFLSGIRKEEGEEGEEDIYWINKETPFELYRKHIIDENGADVKYDFNNTDMEVQDVKSINTLQRVIIDIISPGLKFPFATEYIFTCPQCQTISVKKAYEVICTNKALHCEGIYSYTNADGDLKNRTCKYFMKTPDMEDSNLTDAYVVDVSYITNKERHNAQGITFFPLKPGKYEAVIYYTLGNGKMQNFYIVDIKQPDTNKIIFPIQIENENYLFTLQRTFDDYIEKQTGVKIFGLIPIKVALILQTMAKKLDEKLFFNVMVVGDASTGKTLILKYYLFLLNNYFNLSTNGLSISIPALRGTRSSIDLFGKDYKIVTIGHLGTYHSIHIDEAGESEELVQNLKTFLLESNYSYDKAGGNGISKRRTSHVNLSQNLNPEHLGQYRGAVRKAYKDLNMTMDGIEKDEWNENWDLFLPLHSYDNPQLRKTIREKRSELIQKQKWWIDGLDYALHERFPFYFYLVTNKESNELTETITLNSSRVLIEENEDIARVLYTEDLDKFFETLIPFKHCEEDINAFRKINNIIKDYGYVFDSRQKVMFNMIVRFSRIINKRNFYNEQDYNLIRWFIENTNVKLDVADTNTYNIIGPPNLVKGLEQQKIEEESKTLDDTFGLPNGEF